MVRSTGYVLVPGVLVESLGEHWAAFSPTSGESHLINDTSAALLELLSCETPLTQEQACAALAADVGSLSAQDEAEIHAALQAFVTAGLVRGVPLSRTATP